MQGETEGARDALIANTSLTRDQADDLHVFVTSAGFADRSGAVAALAPALGDGDWAVVDLRALRPHFHRESNREGFEALNELAWGYDLAVVARSFTPAERLPGVPAPPGG